MRDVVRLLSGLAAVGAVWTAEAAAAQTFPVQMQRHQSSYFKDVNRVVLPTYHLTFITGQQATAVAGIGARVRLNKALSGVDEATVRRLADEAHADLKAQLAAAGLAVATDEEARAMVAAAAVPTVPNNVHVHNAGGGVTINKSIRTSYLTVGPTAAPALDPYKPALGNPSMAYMGQIGVNNRIAKGQPQGTLVMIPNLVIDFANVEASAGGGMFGGQRASAGGRPSFGIRGLASTTTLVKVLDRDRMFPTTLIPAKDYDTPTPFATEEIGGASVRPIINVGDTPGPNSRGDAVVVNLPVWEGLVRQAFKDYNAALVASIKAGKR